MLRPCEAGETRHGKGQTHEQECCSRCGYEDGAAAAQCCTTGRGRPRANTWDTACWDVNRTMCLKEHFHLRPGTHKDNMPWCRSTTSKVSESWVLLQLAVGQTRPGSCVQGKPVPALAMLFCKTSVFDRFDIHHLFVNTSGCFPGKPSSFT